MLQYKDHELHEHVKASSGLQKLIEAFCGKKIGK